MVEHREVKFHSIEMDLCRQGVWPLGHTTRNEKVKLVTGSESLQ